MKITIVGGAGRWAAFGRPARTPPGTRSPILDVSPRVRRGDRPRRLDRRATRTAREIASRLPATDDAAAIGPAEAIFFFTKAHHTAAAAELRPPAGRRARRPSSACRTAGATPTRWRASTRPRRSRWASPTTRATVVAPGRIAHTNQRAPPSSVPTSTARRWTAPRRSSDAADCGRHRNDRHGRRQDRGLEKADPQLRDAADRRP